MLLGTELDGEITVKSLLLGFREAVDNIEDRAFVLIGIFTAIAYLFLTKNDRVLILHFVGKKAVVPDTHFHADLERDSGSSSLADELIDFFHVRHPIHSSTHLPQCGQKYSQHSQSSSQSYSSSKSSSS